MIPCVVLGDSIAVGTGATLGQCQVRAKVGIRSGVYLDKYGPAADATVAIISLGANDLGDGVETIREHLEKVRARQHAKVFVWLLPSRPHAAREAIYYVAGAHGDVVIDTAPFATGPDHLHPTGAGYREIGREALFTSATGGIAKDHINGT